MKSRIVLYAFKSDRRNSKCTTHSISTYHDNFTGAKLKSKFTIYNIYDFIEWCCCQEYNRFNMVVYQDDTPICTINNFPNTSVIEQIITRLYKYMRLMNMQEFPMTLSELYYCPNINYLTDKYYRV